MDEYNSMDLNWYLNFGITASVIFGLIYLVKNASKYFVVVHPSSSSMMPGIVATSKSCFVCGTLTKKHCSRCKGIRYCSESCQRSHWFSGHKEKCEEIRLSLQGRRNPTGVAVVPDTGNSTQTKKPWRNSSREKMKGRRKSLDRISFLPQETIEKILTHMPIRDALRTSILSRKWRYSWTRIPKLVFDVNMDMVVLSSGDEKINRYKFANAIFHILLLRRAPILEFSLFVNTKIEIFSEIDQIILHLSMRNNNIKKLVFEIDSANDFYKLPHSFFSLQGLEHLDLSYCVFDCPLMNKGFSKLKSLHFDEVDITNKMLFKFLTNCPLLEEFTWITGYNAGIVLTESELVELFKCLPSVQVLKTSKLYIKHLAAGGMPHKLPISLPHLRILDLGVCFLELSSVLCVISNSPHLEKIKLKMCWDHDRRCLQQIFKTLLDDQEYSGLILDHLKELEITNFHNHALEMEFVKLVMAKSPVLNKARIELNSEVSVEEELRMLRDLLHIPFQRASPAAKFIIQR